MKRLRAGVIGLGVGMRHCEAYANDSRCVLAHVCDFDDKKLAVAKERFPGCSVSQEADNLLVDDSLDIISIASYDNYHCDQVITALGVGKNVIVEKPMCLSRKEAKKIRALLDKHPELKLSSNLVLRTCPRFKEARRLVQEGKLGALFYVEADYLWGRVAKLTDGWRKEMPFYSLIYGASVHMIDLLIWILGQRPVKVVAQGNQIVTHDSGFRFNDFAVILLTFENGLIAKIAASGGCVHPHYHKLTVYGSDRTFVHEFERELLFSSSDPAVEPEILKDAYPGNRKDEVIRGFVASVSGKSSETEIPSDDVFASLSVCFAAEDSMAQGMPVRIAYL